MNNEVQWDDLRVVLAVAEAGSLSGAARRLGSSHATVFRRLRAIERRLGVRLFERSRTGYTPTPSGEELAGTARTVERQVHDVERRIVGRDLKPSGIVRVTTTDSLLAGLLSPMLAGFRRAYPDIALEIVVSNELFSLSRREADVAVRPASAPPESLVGRRIATIAQAAYRRRDLAGDRLDWIGPDERMGYRALETWMTVQGLADRCSCRVDSVLGMHLAVREGMGLAVLPCYLGDADERLLRIGETVPDLATDLWLLTHADLRRVARIRAFLDFVADRVRASRDLLLGAASANHGFDSVP